MSDEQEIERKKNEQRHGRKIAPDALGTWGWSTAAGQERARRRAELLIQLGELGVGKIILEFGCGTGFFSHVFCGTGARVVAIDISQDLIRQAKSSNYPNLNLVIADAEHLPFASASFEAVIGSSVIHHLQPERALAEAWRVLAPGNPVAFAEPNMLNPQIALQKNITPLKRWMGDSPDETAFFRWEIARMLNHLGYTDIYVEPYDFLHPLIPESLVKHVKRLALYLEKIPGLREIAGSLIFKARKDAGDFPGTDDQRR
jgi:SAM-dependent methyltransferase